MVQQVNWVDIAVLLLLVGGLGFGFSRGIISMVTTVFSSVIGILCATTYGESIILVPNLPKIVNYILLFFIGSISTYFIGLVIRKILHAALLGLVDRIIGAVVGLICGFIVASATFYLLTIIPSTKNYLIHSYSSKVFSKIINWDDIMPKQIKDIQNLPKEVQQQIGELKNLPKDSQNKVINIIKDANKDVKKEIKKEVNKK